VTLLTGCQPSDVVDADCYRRLTGDLGRNGKVMIADLTGPTLRGALSVTTLVRIPFGKLPEIEAR
jgi:hypothetical protein